MVLNKKNRNSHIPPLSLSSSSVAPPSTPPHLLSFDLHTARRRCRRRRRQRRVQANCTSKPSHPSRRLPQFVFGFVFFPASASARLHLRRSPARSGRLKTSCLVPGTLAAAHLESTSSWRFGLQSHGRFLLDFYALDVKEENLQSRAIFWRLEGPL